MTQQTLQVRVPVVETLVVLRLCPIRGYDAAMHMDTRFWYHPLHILVFSGDLLEVCLPSPTLEDDSEPTVRSKYSMWS
jgi:hypothetical protein